LSGCGAIGDALDKFQKAIDEVAAFRKMVESEGKAWREKLGDMQTTLTKDVKTVINTDLRDNIDETIEKVGIEARCEIQFVETKLLSYLRAIEKALVAKRDEIKKKGTLDGLTPEEIIDQVIKSQGHIQPFACHVDVSKELVIKFVNNYGEAERLSIDNGKGTVRITGFALKRPKDEEGGYSLLVHGEEGEPRALEKTGRFLTQSTTYRLLVDVEKMVPYLKSTDTKVELRCGGESVCEFKLSFGDRPPPPERLKDVYVYVKTGNNNKECGGWHVQIYQRNERIFEETWGFGDNWDNGSEKPKPEERHKKVDVLLTGEPLKVTSTIEEREGEVRIDWNIEVMQVILTTSRDRKIVFERSNFTHKSRGDGGALKTLDVNLK
jgi:hypothetical protein